jgi:bifunctional DNase/RNase
MKKKQMQVIGLSYSQSQMDSYIVVLSEIKGSRKIPLIVKPMDAQQIASRIEGLKSDRPLIHDVIKSITDSFDMDIQEVHIHSVLEGIFHTNIVVSNGLDEIQIECSVADGITLSYVYECPIYVSQSVLDMTGITIEVESSAFGVDDSKTSKKPKTVKEKPKRVMSIKDLEKMIETALGNEDYETAAKLRDKITALKEEEANKK